MEMVYYACPACLRSMGFDVLVKSGDPDGEVICCKSCGWVGFWGECKLRREVLYAQES